MKRRFLLAWSWRGAPALALYLRQGGHWVWWQRQPRKSHSLAGPPRGSLCSPHGAPSSRYVCPAPPCRAHGDSLHRLGPEPHRLLGGCRAEPGEWFPEAKSSWQSGLVRLSQGVSEGVPQSRLYWGGLAAQGCIRAAGEASLTFTVSACGSGGSGDGPDRPSLGGLSYPRL